MNNYGSNSHKSKSENAVTPTPSRASKVTTGKVNVKKKGVVETCIDSFVNEEIPNIKSYLVKDVLIPTIKNTIWDAFTNTLDMILYNGDGKGPKRNGPGSSRNGANNYVSYNKYSSRDDRRNDNNNRRARYDFSYVTFDRERDAKDVLAQMDEIMEQYKLVRVADFYEMIGETPSFTDQKYGWNDIRNAKIRSTRSGYYIDLPKPLLIE